MNYKYFMFCLILVLNIVFNVVTFRHVGDLGNIMENSDGAVKLSNMEDRMIKLHGSDSILNRAIVVSFNYMAQIRGKKLPPFKLDPGSSIE